MLTTELMNLFFLCKEGIKFPKTLINNELNERFPFEFNLVVLLDFSKQNFHTIHEFRRKYLGGSISNSLSYTIIVIE